MRERLVSAVRDALDGGGATAAVLLVDGDAGLEPRVVMDPSDPFIERVHTGDGRYPVASFAVMMIPVLDGGVAVVARECDRRMLVELAKHGQVDLERLAVIGIPCSQELADSCGCGHPCPGDSVAPPAARPAVAEPPQGAVAEDPAERLSFWMEHFARCIKCMGCRNVCPMCFCRECALDDLDVVGPASSPPDIPIFHLIRAVDMSDRCVDCGMCEAVCTAEIPLRQLYRQACGAVMEAFGYEPGADPEEKSPLEMLGEPSGLAGMDGGFRAGG